MGDAEREQMSEIKEAILEGKAIELIPSHEGLAWYAKIGMLDHEVHGTSAADVLLTLSRIVAQQYTV